MTQPAVTTTQAPPSLLGRWRARSRATSFLDLLFVPAVLFGLGLYLSVATDAFLTGNNIRNVLLQASILAIVAFGVTFVILAGELDLSLGTGVALVSVVAAIAIQESGSIALGIVVAIGTGLLIGVVNGTTTTRLRVPSFIATLGMFIIAHAIALQLTDGAVIYGLPEGVGTLTNESFLSLQYVIWLMFGVFLVSYFLQTQTRFGVQVFAIGDNREAARLSGIPVDRIRFLVFALSGITIGIGGAALMARLESGQPNAAGLLALEAIAAVVIGGTSLMGGRGSVVRTLWGVLLIAVVRNGLDLQGIDEDFKQITIGCLFIMAASVDFFRRQFTARGTQVRRRKPAAVPGEPPERKGDGSRASDDA